MFSLACQRGRLSLQAEPRTPSRPPPAPKAPLHHLRARRPRHLYGKRERTRRMPAEVEISMYLEWAGSADLSLNMVMLPVNPTRPALQ